MTDAAWFAERTDGAPDALRERAAAFFRDADGADLVERLAVAGDHALGVATAARSRDGALDLLAADALITLALLAQAESAPEQLGAFAATLLQDDRPPT